MSLWAILPSPLIFRWQRSGSPPTQPVRGRGCGTLATRCWRSRETPIGKEAGGSLTGTTQVWAKDATAKPVALFNRGDADYTSISHAATGRHNRHARWRYRSFGNGAISCGYRNFKARPCPGRRRADLLSSARRSPDAGPVRIRLRRSAVDHRSFHEQRRRHIQGAARPQPAAARALFRAPAFQGAARAAQAECHWQCEAPRGVATLASGTGASGAAGATLSSGSSG